MTRQEVQAERYFYKAEHELGLAIGALPPDHQLVPSIKAVRGAVRVLRVGLRAEAAPEDADCYDDDPDAKSGPFS